ncbi:FG-GAP-like repeat-containing protein [Streptomyces diastatochromogenes]|nr:FG-GAP-like repeat-containing protein [Streptomyces diastatochromogenes]
MIRSNRGRRALAATVTTAASLATLMTAAPSASAGEDRCPSGRLCVFQYRDYQGEMKIITSSQATLGAWDDKISSVVNHSGLYALLWGDPGYGGGETLQADPHNGGVSFEGSILGRLDNRISSIRLATTSWEVSSGIAWMDWSPMQKRPGGLPAAARFGDLDNDAAPDVVERADDGRLWYLDGAPGAAWKDKGALIGGGWNAMTQIVRHGDYDGDGFEDVYARDKAGVLWFYPGNGRGWFKPRLKVGAGWNTMKEIEAVGDLTGDGRRDLVARDTAGVLWMYPGNGRGWFGARKKVGGGWNAMNSLTAPGDMTGDGTSDLVARDGSRGLWLYPGNGRGWFGTRVRLPYAWPSDAPVFSVGDVTGDGKSDLLRPIGLQVFVYPATAAAASAARRPTWAGTPPSASTSSDGRAARAVPAPARATGRPGPRSPSGGRRRGRRPASGRTPWWGR